MSLRRPRIALTTRFPLGQAGGIESAVREIAPRLAAKRPAWDVHTMYAFASVTRFNRIPLIGDVLAAVLLRVKASNHDIVVVNGAEYAWPFLLCRDRARTIVVWHGTRVGEIPALVAKMSPAVKVYHALETRLQRFALHAARAIAVSETTLTEIRTAYATAVSIAVIPNGAPEIGELAATGSPSGHRVAWIGTSPYKKGLDIALAACERVRKSYPDLELVVIGAAVARQQPWVRMLGRCDHALSLQTLCGADVLLATSRYEGCSVAIIEALALGLPIVASPSDAWMIGPGGVAIEDYGVEHYARALAALFASPQTLAAKSRGARRRARAFDWNVAADAYVREVETCLSAP